MSQPIHSPESVVEALTNRSITNTYQYSEGVDTCNACGEKIMDGDEGTAYVVYKSHPNSSSDVWLPIARFCSECDVTELTDVSDDYVGHPAGRPGYRRYWSHKPEAVVSLSLEATVTRRLTKFTDVEIEDYNFGRVHERGYSGIGGVNE